MKQILHLLKFIHQHLMRIIFCVLHSILHFKMIKVCCYFQAY